VRSTVSRLHRPCHKEIREYLHDKRRVLNRARVTTRNFDEPRSEAPGKFSPLGRRRQQVLRGRHNQCGIIHSRVLHSSLKIPERRHLSLLIGKRLRGWMLADRRLKAGDVAGRRKPREPGEPSQGGVDQKVIVDPRPASRQQALKRHDGCRTERRRRIDDDAPATHVGKPCKHGLRYGAAHRLAYDGWAEQPQVPDEPRGIRGHRLN
jgi:hypothetical protein